jgi:putative endonuclease
MKERTYYVYILTKERNSVFYVCITNSLLRRVYEHKEEIISGFTKKQDVKMLVYYEWYNEIHKAICREKIIKKWKNLK